VTTYSQVQIHLFLQVDKKRAFFEHNEEAWQSRNLWIEFVALAINAK